MTMNCPICNRPLGSIRIEEHHLVPKTFKGKETISLHGICHRKIHSVFTERELQHYYFTIERLLESEHIQTFVKWVSKRPPEFYDSTKETSSRKSKRY